MNNKRGIVKIAEAIIAVMIVLSVIVFLNFNRDFEPPQENLTDEIRALLDEIAKGELRIEVINYDTASDSMDQGNAAIIQKIMDFLEERIINPKVGFGITICEPDDLCPLNPYPPGREVYSEERIISTYFENTEGFEPKKIRIFLWMEN